MKNGRLHHESDRKEWRLDGLKHRIGGPAVIWKNTENEEWWFMGKRHRVDGPAVIKYDKMYIFPIADRKKRRNMTVNDYGRAARNISFELNVREEEYWYNDKKYDKEGYEFIILFQQADKMRKYI